MVRIKNRYLLVQILYPHNLPASSKTPVDAPPPALLTPPTSALLSLYAPTPDTLTSQTLLRALRSALSTLFGEHGAGTCASGLQVKYWSNATSSAIVRCRREVVRLVWAAAALVSSLRADGPAGEEVKCVLRVLRVSGTIRKCEEEAIRRARGLLGRARGLEEAERGGVELEGAGRRELDGDVGVEGEDGESEGSEEYMSYSSS